MLELREPIAIFVPQPGDASGVTAGLINERLDVGEGRFVCLLTGNALFAMRFTVIRNAQRADEERQRKTLEDQRDKNDAEREKDDLIAPGERRSGGGGNRQREGGCERHDTPHAGPRDDRDVLPSRVRVAGANSLADEARQVGCREDQENSSEHDGGAHCRRIEQEGKPGSGSQPVDNRGKLQPDQE